MPTLKVKQADLYYEVAGDGDPVVLCPGGFLDHVSWVLVVPLLADAFRVITYDPPGHGQSTGDMKGDPFGAFDDFAAFMEALDIAPAHFVGVSGGGTSALHLAARRPDLVRSLSVHEASLGLGLLTGAVATEAQEMVSYTAGKLREGKAEEGLIAFMAKFDVDWSVIPQPLQAAILHNAASYGDWFGDLTHPVWTLDDRFSAFTGPVQLTRGDQSPSLVQEYADVLESAIPQAEVVVIEGAGHAVMFEQPARYAAVVTSFFEKQAR